MLQHRSVVAIKIYPLHHAWWILSSFLASLSPWLVNEKVRNCWRGVDELYGLYLLHHANAKCMYAWLHHLLLASLSLWLVNKKVRNHSRGVDELFGLYLLCHDNGQMHMCLIASSVKIINKALLSCTNSGQPGWFHVETYMWLDLQKGVLYVQLWIFRIIILK